MRLSLAQAAVALLVTWGSPAFGQTVRFESVLPAATDPAVSGWLSPHSAAFAPDANHRDQLFVYLHGEGGTGSGATELLRTAAEQGYHAIGLTYPNDWSPFNLCVGSSDPACAENIRREILDGTDRTPLISVSRANSVENRLIKVLGYLNTQHPDEAWSEFAPAGQLRWDLIVVWGHSQGGGNAGVLARQQSLARVCLSAPAADGGQGNPAPWWALHATPADRYFGFCHAQDVLSTKVAFWNALGMGAFGGVVEVVGATAPYSNTHELSAAAEPAIAGQYHNSVVLDALTPRVAGAGSTPVYKSAWQYMMTAGSGSPGPGGQIWNDLPFATVPGLSGPVTLMMDVYGATTGTGPRPVLVWIHGGGWQSGSHNQTPSFALALRARGITVASIGYRLSGEAIFPAQIHDCKGAIRYLRANAAAFSIDPARIGTWGSSAGGHLAALVTTSGDVSGLEGDTGGNLGVSSRVLAGVSFFGPTDILHMQEDCAAQPLGCAFNHDDPTSPESRLLGVSGAGEGLAWLRSNQANPNSPFPGLVARARDANPISHVQATDPPLYLAHGDRDTTVPIGQSFKLRDALQASGVETIMVSVPGAGHGALGAAAEIAASDWLVAHLFAPLPCSPECPADFDCSGNVNPDDLGDYITAFFSAPPGPGADFNGDGEVNPDDLGDFVTSYFSAAC